MAQTLKFGSGTWATKKGSTLAYNDEGGNFKPLPFTYTGAGKGTRVNKEGLIEVVENDRPRIDYTDSEDGVLLLEPSRTNYIPYSTLDFNGGVKPNGWSIGFGTGSYSYEQLEYKGQKAVKQTQITTGRSYLDTGSITILANTEHTLKIQFILDECIADANDNVVAILGFGINVNYQFSDIDENGILELQYNPLSDNIGNIRIGLGSIQNEDGGKSLAWAIPQLEQGSYATSYIPTQGTIQTRVQETASGSGNSEVFNSEQGVLFANMSTDSDTTVKAITLGDGTSSNRIQLFYFNGVSIYGACVVGGVSQASIFANLNVTNNIKVIFRYKLNDFALWVNGFKVGVDTNGAIPTGLKVLNFDNGVGSSDFYGKTKEISYYDEVLTDLELETLTSYRTWESMVKELNLNIIHNE